MSINKVMITGNLTRDAELRTTPSGTAILNVGVAVNDRRRNPQTGDWEDYANFVDCTMFGKRAEALNHALVRRAIAMEGTCTGEHGIGIHKQDFLREECGEGAIAMMRAIKQALDPENILNPGKIFALWAQARRSVCVLAVYRHSVSRAQLQATHRKIDAFRPKERCSSEGFRCQAWGERLAPPGAAVPHCNGAHLSLAPLFFRYR